LGYLDGIRALAALFILFDHAFRQVEFDKNASALAPWIAKSFDFLNYGTTLVVVFIVLSGFCLMLPVANTPDRKPRGGWKEYFFRRAKRILPPYYAALLMSLILIFLTPGLQEPTGRAWDTAVPALSPYPIVAHLFLFHDFTARCFTSIDPPMWSIAIEWHIYLLFPVLLFTWRKLGILMVVPVGMFLGYLPHRLSHGLLDFAPFHYIGLFTVGMVACWISFSNALGAARLRASVPWLWVTALLVPQSIFAITHRFGFLSRLRFTDYVPALGTGSLLIYCTVASHWDTNRNSYLVRLLEAPWIVSIGQFSYSLYLIHYPLQALVYLGLFRFVPSPELRLCIMWFLCCPIIVGLANYFHLIFEKPFMSASAKQVHTNHS